MTTFSHYTDHMTRELTPAEQAIWSQVTKGIKPLGESGANVSLDDQYFKVSVNPAPTFHPTIDLHGLIIQDAFEAVQQHIETGRRLGYKKLTVITGRSGQINLEMPRWFADHPLVRSINSLRGGGAWEIWLKKRGT